jgi:cobalt-zinc-cadmium efflux system protein
VARLWAVLTANLALARARVGVGSAAHSLGVFAAGADYLAGSAAISVSLLAIYLSHRPPSAKHPHGYPRATLLAAGVNAHLVYMPERAAVA